jgi:hypothetical protein
MPGAVHVDHSMLVQVCFARDIAILLEIRSHEYERC